MNRSRARQLRRRVRRLVARSSNSELRNPDAFTSSRRRSDPRRPLAAPSLRHHLVLNVFAHGLQRHHRVRLLELHAEVVYAEEEPRDQSRAGAGDPVNKTRSDELPMYENKKINSPPRATGADGARGHRQQPQHEAPGYVPRVAHRSRGLRGFRVRVRVRFVW